MLLRSATTIIAGLLAFAHSAAQVERVLPMRGAETLEGRSFVVSFLQNEIMEMSDQRVLQIFISSQYDAMVQIEPAVGSTIQVPVKANDVAVLDMPQIYMMNESELPRKRAIFITSDVPVVVYALNSIALSTDTYTAIPIKSLGTEYYTINRCNDQYLPSTDPNGNFLNLTVRQSEFMVVAIEDQTTVDITPKYVTERGFPAGQTMTVTLDRGECYLVKSLDVPIGMGDLTGSKVTADKPVAVLSGAVRASIPVSQGASKDHLVEMLPPTSTWGKSYAAIPFAIVSQAATNKVRLIASQPDTRIEVFHGVSRYSRQLSQAGDWTEVDLTEASFYRSDKPFLAVQFMPSRVYVPGVYSTLNGDPAMVVLPALDQYLASTMFRFPELLTQYQLPDQEFHYFVGIVAEEAALPTLQVNGQLVSDLSSSISWQLIPGTNLHWANLELRLGTYAISADSGLFGGVMYGLSQADSYANLFGAAYDNSSLRSRTPPRYTATVDCGEIHGRVVDVPVDSAQLTEVTVQTSRCVNYQWEVNGPLDSSGTTEFTATVRDLWKDGTFVIHAYDSSGNGREWLYEYDAPSVSLPASVAIDLSKQTSNCSTIAVVNTNDRPLHIKTIAIAGDSRITVNPTPFPDTTIAPGDTLDVVICVDRSLGITLAKATLTLDLECGLKKSVLIQALNTAQLVARGVDFGAVRIGDTACSQAYVVNSGSIAVTITSGLLEASIPEFDVDVAGLGLPVVLAPGDTLWIPVCFVPTSEQDVVRTDSIVSTEAGMALVTHTGTGVRPRVSNIVIDWGKRRLGSTSDTTFRFVNSGSGACMIDTVWKSMPSGEFEMYGQTVPLALPSASSTTANARYQAGTLGRRADTIDIVTDWPRHEPVSIVLTGEGTMPEIRTIDVDMGKVVVFTQKDSVADVVECNGTERLTLMSVIHGGADVTSFTIGSGLEAPSIHAPGDLISIPVRFSPTRLGTFDMTITVVSDAAMFGELDTSIIHIVGEGVAVPVTRLDAELQVAAQVVACKNDTGFVDLRNSGTTIIDIDTITVTADGAVLPLLGSIPASVQPDSAVRIPFVMALSRLNQAEIQVDLRYDETETWTASQTVRVVPSVPDVSVTMPATSTVGEVIRAHVLVEEDQALDLPQPFTAAVQASDLQWSIDSRPVLVTITDATGTWQEQVVPAPVAGGVLVTLAREVLAPYQVITDIEGTVLLNSASAVVVRATAQQTVCADSAGATAVTTADVCGGALRMVRLTDNPSVVAKLNSNPAYGTVDMDLEAESSTSIEIELRSLAGGIIAHKEYLKLEKGVQHCNFSVNSLASGLYGLVLRDGRGEQVIPVIIVN